MRHTGGGGYKAEVGVRGDPVPTDAEAAAATLCKVNRRKERKKETRKIEDFVTISEKRVLVAQNKWRYKRLKCQH